MSSIIGRLRVILGLETAAFETGAKRAEARAKSMGNEAEALGFKVGAAGRAMVAAGAAVAGGAVFAAVKTMVTDSLAYAKALENQARLAGASVEEFQRAAYAAKSVGIESEKLADIYKDVNDKIGEFLQTGGGEMKDFFQNIAPKVGVTAEQFRNLSGPDALQLYVSTLEKAGVSQKEMTFYMEAIADEASAMTPLLRDGGKAFDELGGAAQRMGLVLTSDQVQRMSEAAKKLEDLKTVLSASISVAVADNVDSIMALVNALVALIEKTGSAIRAWQNWRREVANRQDQGIVDGWLTSDADKRAAQARIDTRNSKSRVIMPAGETTKPTGPRPKTGFGAPLNIDASKFPDPWANTSRSSLLRNGGRSNQALDPRFLQMGGGGSLLAMAAGIPIFLPAGLSEAFAPIGKGSTEEVEKMQAAQEELIQTTQQLKGVTKETAASMQRSFEESAQGIIGALDRLEGSIRGGGFMSILSSVIGLGMELGSAGLFGSKIAGNINRGRSIPAYATGTSFHPGGLALVGERGPELVDLPRGAAVYPNGTGPGGDGGRTTVYNLSGNLLTPEFWAEIEKRDRVAAAAGAQGGMRLMTRARARTL